jgi:hypothetical protein
LLFLCSKNRLDVGDRGWFVTRSKHQVKGKIIPSMKCANAVGNAGLEDLKSFGDILESSILPETWNCSFSSLPHPIQHYLDFIRKNR